MATVTRKDAGRARTIKASEFKAKCLKLMDEVAESGEAIVITKNGRPVSRLTPYRGKSQMTFGRNRDNIRILGDIVEPMPAEWFEDADHPDENLF
ncbi:MAG: type II toxin-antitoxin system Phd/YefM family antitoxin [Gammaproteobacteria bacterium]|nr:type II toxin-antitoxin system Phd/YefM family antitoxin [Gammaproteobacteria bacterium]MCY3988029.1 type II toxin-antitoxin system Phd/YefM family antitoxin [Gammaproteobacteria bacterium]